MISTLVEDIKPSFMNECEFEKKERLSKINRVLIFQAIGADTPATKF